MAGQCRSACPSIPRRRGRTCRSKCARPWSGRDWTLCGARLPAQRRTMLAEMKLKGGTMPKRQQDTDDDLFDERGLLRDGARIRIPMMMRDSDGLTDLQRSVRDEFAPTRVVD